MEKLDLELSSDDDGSMPEINKEADADIAQVSMEEQISIRDRVHVSFGGVYLNVVVMSWNG